MDIADKRWTITAQNTLTPTKKFLSQLSIKVRTDQFALFREIFNPNKSTIILDVGVASEEILPDSNMFEKLYPHQANITLATIENRVKLKKIYPKSRVVQIYPHRKLPFRKREFDVAVSWATIEHVGNYKRQREFLCEMSRVANSIFLTTPYRGCIYEPHTGFFFLHWLPLKWFRKICLMTGRNFWATEKNLNPLYIKNIKAMSLSKNLVIKKYNMWGVLPSHLIIYTTKK